MSYPFTGIHLLADVFENEGIHFRVQHTKNFEFLEVDIPIDCGQAATARFIASDNSNDISFRAFHFISSVPKHKWPAVAEVCKECNRTAELFRFFLDRGAVHVAFDLPERISDEAVGSVFLEVLSHAAVILNNAFPYFMKAIFCDFREAEEEGSQEET